MSPPVNDLIAIEARFGAQNYEPLGVVLSRGKGVWVWDTQGKRYLDCLSAYSAVNQGHCHPKILAAMIEQAGKLTLTSRAFHNDQLAPFYEQIAELTGSHKVLPMNSGAEAVESAIKSVRKWGYEVKGVPDGQAEIIVCADNFHGRTLGIIGFSTDAAAREHFGPSGSSPSATPRRWRRQSRRTRSPSSSSQSRVKPALSFRPPAISQRCASSAPPRT
jgi:ornithine--oxo-acid transaminase